MHEVTHRLIVYAHNLADIVIFALLNIVELYYLLLSGRQAFYIFCKGVVLFLLFFDAFHVVCFAVEERLDVVIVNLVVADMSVVSELVVDSVP